MTEEPPQSLVRELREAAADVSYRWRQDKARGDADVLAHVYSRAELAGASPEELSQIRGGFPAIARQLLDGQGQRRRRRAFVLRRRRASAAVSTELPPPPRPHQLPPGG
jgi:hypothetical protein